MVADDIAGLFTSVARAALDTQARLDWRLPSRPPFAYSLPRVEVSSRFGVTEVAGRPFLWFGHRTQEDRINTLTFRLLASHIPPPPRDRGTTADTATVLVPPFLVSADERRAMVRDLADDLTDRGFTEEAARIRIAAASRQPAEGVTFLRLSPTRVLIVRTGGPVDGVFIRDDTSTPRHAIYDAIDREQDRVLWAPFHELFARMRHWQTMNTASTIAGVA